MQPGERIEILQYFLYDTWCVVCADFIVNGGIKQVCIKFYANLGEVLWRPRQWLLSRCLDIKAWALFLCLSSLILSGPAIQLLKTTTLEGPKLHYAQHFSHSSAEDKQDVHEDQRRTIQELAGEAEIGYASCQWILTDKLLQIWC